MDKRGMPIYRIESCGGDMTTIMAFGGEDRKTLYITDSDNGQILVARMPAPRLRLYYSHA